MPRRCAEAGSTLGSSVAARRSSRKAPETPLIGKSVAIERVRKLIDRAAPTDANVLILGENGTGKEIVAREIHRLSRRADKPMVSVDLGATSETLFESELFGHAKGAFTGAAGERIGRLKAADESSLFLDEIGNLPLHLQPKLLTALEQRAVVPVGANKPIPIDVRVIAATNVSEDQLADEKRFRQDLLFRLNTIEIELPPLRHRRDDIPVLLDHYLRLYERKYDRPERELPPAVLEALIAHDWPGQRARAPPRRRAGGDHGGRRSLQNRRFPVAEALGGGRGRDGFERDAEPRSAREADDRARA